MEKITEKCNILLALAGLNPQIVTEGYYCLEVQKKVSIGRIVILTTKDCKEMINGSLKDEILSVSKHYALKPPTFYEEDIFFADENFDDPNNDESFSNITFNLIRDLTSSDNNVLHCLISGGRKTMSIDIATALTLYGRDCDRMYHVLVHKDFEIQELFSTRSKVDSDKIKLIDKPFIKLREKFLSNIEDKKQNYSETLSQFQRELDNTIELEPVVIDKYNRNLIIGGKVINLPPFLFSVYLFFAQQKRFIKGGKNFSKANSEAIWNIYRRVSTSQGQTERVAKSLMHNGCFDFDVIQKAICNIRRHIKTSLNNHPISDFYTISVEGSYADKRYGIKLPKNKIIIERNKQENR